jgi:serine/threonine protein kinase
MFFNIELKKWDENYIYLYLEFCAGGDLSSFIKSRRTIPEKYVKRFVQQIGTDRNRNCMHSSILYCIKLYFLNQAYAMMHLHKIGIAHMDLKPQNILLTSANNPSLKIGGKFFVKFVA